MPQIALYGGEKDGQIEKISAEGPPVFYALPASAEQLIQETVGSKAKKDLRQKFSTLGYKLTELVEKSGVGLEYRYLRAPDLDLTPPVDKIA